MYGRYTKDLGEFAKDEARKLKLLEKRRKQEDKQRNKVNKQKSIQMQQLFLCNYSRISTFINYAYLYVCIRNYLACNPY